jgi:predicted MPP superfamily phosphohydrolase
MAAVANDPKGVFWIVIVYCLLKGSEMDRRTFVKSGCLSYLSLLGAGCRTQFACAADDKKDTPLFTFIQLTDTHVNAPFEDDTVYSGANPRMQWFVEALDNGTIAKPDFIVHTGDMVHGAKLENFAPDFGVLDTQVLKKLSVPFYSCVGNHENLQRSGIPEYDQAYINTFGADKFNYTVERGGILFVIFDTSFEPASKELHQQMRQRRNDWLRTVLVENPQTPKILCCHIPLVPLREEEVLKKSFGFVSYKADDDQLVQLLAAHNDTILAVLSGHLHLTGCVRVDGIYHIVPSGLASFPHDYAMFRVYNDRIEVTMESVPQELSAAWRSNIHHRRRHGIDYTDDKHPTHLLYVGGNPDERRFTILIKGR